jgi:hypothetical protein
MNLKGLISITGKPGLYKVVGQGKDRLIVESLTDGKRIPAFASQRISALDDITMYTTDDDAPLREIMKKIFEKENGGPCIQPTEEASKLHDYFAAILPNYDKERVYYSDLKKLFGWYNMLQSTGMLAKIAVEEKEEVKETEAKVENTESSEEKPAKKAKTSVEKKAKASTQPKIKADAKAKSSTTRKINAPKRGA